MSDQLRIDLESPAEDQPAPKTRKRTTRARAEETEAPAKTTTRKPPVRKRTRATVAASDGSSADPAAPEKLAPVKPVARRRPRRAVPAAQTSEQPSAAESVAPEASQVVDAPAQTRGSRAASEAAAPQEQAAPAKTQVAVEADAPAPAKRTRRTSRRSAAAVSAAESETPAASAESAVSEQRGADPAADREPAAPARSQEPAEAASPAPAEASPEAPSTGKYPRRRHYDRREGQPARPQGQQQVDAAQQPAGGQRQQRELYGAGRYQQRDRANGQGAQGGQNGQPNQGGQKQRGYAGAQQQGNRKNKGQRPAREAVQPQTSRDEVEEMKVAELRSKAGELGIDPTGLKKSDLVDAVYRELVKQEGFFEFKGILDIGNDGTGYVRTKSYLPSEGDVYVASGAIRANGLRRGDEIAGIAHAGRPNDKYAGLNKLVTVNGRAPEGLAARPRFGDLTPVFPSEPLRMEHGRDSILGRCIDLVAPIGKGQRGLIVSPPKAGKTTVLKKIAESIAANNPEVHLICLLVDERPEEVTDMQRSIKGEVVASTFDMPCDNHITVSELVIERAKRLVELGEDVVILLDSITRLARAYNLAQPASGRILSGGVDSTALYPPKRFLGAARNIEHGGSLTILASALVDTGSKMDEVIFEEFKGTGNMELKLDRDLADRRVFPAIDPITSGTRKEELLLDPNMAPFVWGIRRILSSMNSNERAMSSLIKSLKATANNEEFLIRSAKKAQLQEGSADF